MGLEDVNEQKVYHFGIIDYLTKYTFKKELERNFKSIGKINYKENLSVAPPDYYGYRFEGFMVCNVLIQKNCI
jgi:hypothetical protein